MTWVTVVGIGASVLGTVGLVAAGVVLYRNRKWKHPGTITGIDPYGRD